MLSPALHCKEGRRKRKRGKGWVLVCPTPFALPRCGQVPAKQPQGSGSALGTHTDHRTTGNSRALGQRPARRDGDGGGESVQLRGSGICLGLFCVVLLCIFHPVRPSLVHWPCPRGYPLWGAQSGSAGPSEERGEWEGGSRRWTRGPAAWAWALRSCYPTEGVRLPVCVQ